LRGAHPRPWVGPREQRDGQVVLVDPPFFLPQIVLLSGWIKISCYLANLNRVIYWSVLFWSILAFREAMELKKWCLRVARPKPFFFGVQIVTTLLWYEGVRFLIKIGVCSHCSIHIWYLVFTKK
jgi:hypothetical protein